MNKRGSHVDVIISFVVFVALIVFLYAILQPTIAAQQNKQSLQSSIESKLLSSMSGSVTSINLKVYLTKSTDCIRLIDLLNITGLNPATIMVVNSTGPISNSNLFTSIPNQGQNQANDLFIESSFFGSQGQNYGTYFFKIYNSSAFETLSSGNQGGGTCQEIDRQGTGSKYYYTIGQTRTENIAFQTYIGSLSGSYNNNYDTLKQTLGIPPTEDFGFEFIPASSDSSYGKIVAMKNPPQSASVYSETIPIEYLSYSGEINEGELIISVW